MDILPPPFLWTIFMVHVGTYGDTPSMSTWYLNCHYSQNVLTWVWRFYTLLLVLKFMFWYCWHLIFPFPWLFVNGPLNCVNKVGKNLRQHILKVSHSFILLYFGVRLITFSHGKIYKIHIWYHSFLGNKTISLIYFTTITTKF